MDWKSCNHQSMPVELCTQVWSTWWLRIRFGSRVHLRVKGSFITMDKDNRDDFTFAKLSDLKLPVTVRMYCYSLFSPFKLLNSPTQIPIRRKPATEIFHWTTRTPWIQVSRITVVVSKLNTLLYFLNNPRAQGHSQIYMLRANWLPTINPWLFLSAPPSRPLRTHIREAFLRIRTCKMAQS